MTPVYQLFFRRAQKTMLEICEREFRCKPGIVLTLHTWGQRMLTHVHIHAMLTAGGISIAKSSSKQSSGGSQERWVSIDPDAPAIQEQFLADRFQKKFLRGLKLLYAKGKLELPADLLARGIADRESFEAWLDELGEIDWKADAKITPEHLLTNTGCASYLSEYIAGSAIHDQRMVDDDGKNVTISQWDYRNDKYVRETMSGEEFVERFALHIVPRSVHRVRYAGLFQGKGRTETLAKVRSLIAQHQASPNRSTHKPANAYLLKKGEKAPESRKKSDDPENRPRCNRCGTPGMKFVGHQDRFLTKQFVRTLEHWIREYSKVFTTMDESIRADQRTNKRPVQGSLLHWRRQQALDDLFDVSVVSGLDTRYARDAFGAMQCSVSRSIPLPEI